VNKHSGRRWVLFTLGVFAIILVPYLLFGPQIEAWTESFLETAYANPVLVGVVLCLLLIVDIVVPIPSSLVSTAAGIFLGFVGGVIASWVGMSVCCVLGYYLGRKLGRPAAHRVVGPDELSRLEALRERFGDWVIVISRPVPMLAEASIFFAGISRMALPRFLLLALLANLGISVVYAAVGAFSANISSFLFAFVASILVPLAALLITSRLGLSVGES